MNTLTLNENSFTSGRIAKKMILFAIPLLATSVVLQLFNTLDMAIAGQFLGKQAFAAIGSTSTISGLFIEFFLAFSNASNVIISRFLGENNKEQAQRAVHSSVVISLLCGIFIAVVGFFSANSILSLMSIPSDIIGLSATYLKIYFLGMPFFMLYNFCSAIFRSKGDTKTPMLCLISGGILKVVLDLFFVAVLKLGVLGVAVATIFANALSAFLLIYFLIKRNDELKLEFKKLKLQKDILISFLKIGLPSGFLGSVFSISNLCVQSAINSLGTDIIAASSAAASVEIYIQFFGNAFATAATTFTSHNYGAKKYDRLHKVTFNALLLCNAVTVTLSLITFGFSSSLLKIFVTETAVIALAQQRMVFTLLFKPIQAIMDIMSGCLQGYGYTLVPAIASIFGVCGVRVLWIYTVFAASPSLKTLMVIYPITQGIAALSHSICYTLLVKRIKKSN